VNGNITQRVGVRRIGGRSPFRSHWRLQPRPAGISRSLGARCAADVLRRQLIAGPLLSARVRVQQRRHRSRPPSLRAVTSFPAAPSWGCPAAQPGRAGCRCETRRTGPETTISTNTMPPTITISVLLRSRSELPVRSPAGPPASLEPPCLALPSPGETPRGTSATTLAVAAPPPTSAARAPHPHYCPDGLPWDPSSLNWTAADAEADGRKGRSVHCAAFRHLQKTASRWIVCKVAGLKTTRRRLALLAQAPAAQTVVEDGELLRRPPTSTS